MDVCMSNEIQSLLIKYWILNTRLSSQTMQKHVVQICRLSHFDYVKSEDLEKIGMGKPAIRRLVDAVKKRNRKKSLFEKVVLLLVIYRLVIDITMNCSVLD